MSPDFSYKFLLLPIFIPLILVCIWFRNGLIIGGGEEGLPFYNPAKTIELSGMWLEHVTGISNLGLLPRNTLFYPLSFLHENFHIPSFILQALTFFFFFFFFIFFFFFFIFFF